MAHRLVHRDFGVVYLLFGVPILAVSGDRWTVAIMDRGPFNLALVRTAARRTTPGLAGDIADFCGGILISNARQTAAAEEQGRDTS
jgi:hypothetical protein